MKELNIFFQIELFFVSFFKDLRNCLKIFQRSFFIQFELSLTQSTVKNLNIYASSIAWYFSPFKGKTNIFNGKLTLHRNSLERYSTTRIMMDSSNPQSKVMSISHYLTGQEKIKKKKDSSKHVINIFIAHYFSLKRM